MSGWYEWLMRWLSLSFRFCTQGCDAAVLFTQSLFPMLPLPVERRRPHDVAP